MNELSTHDFSMQELANLIGRQSQNTDLLLGRVGELSQNVAAINDYVKKEFQDVRSDIKEIRDNSEVTTQQRCNIRRSVHKHICSMLSIPVNSRDWTLEDRVKSEKYSKIFHQRCYSEVAKKGHLGSPYGTTIAINYLQAIQDIEAWTPSNGISGLMKEADDNATAKKIAREQGY